jgi:hypothetical protein
MKLLCCMYCEDVFKLSFKPRKCDCGRVAGYYLNNMEAVVSPDAVSIAIGNGSFLIAQGQLQSSVNAKLNREEWQLVGKIMAWVRPNEGVGNPHTRVVPREEIEV